MLPSCLSTEEGRVEIRNSPRQCPRLTRSRVGTLSLFTCSQARECVCVCVCVCDIPGGCHLAIIFVNYMEVWKHLEFQQVPLEQWPQGGALFSQGNQRRSLLFKFCFLNYTFEIISDSRKSGKNSTLDPPPNPSIVKILSRWLCHSLSPSPQPLLSLRTHLPIYFSGLFENKLLISCPHLRCQSSLRAGF